MGVILYGTESILNANMGKSNREVDKLVEILLILNKMRSGLTLHRNHEYSTDLITIKVPGTINYSR